MSFSSLNRPGPLARSEACHGKSAPAPPQPRFIASSLGILDAGTNPDAETVR